RLGIAKDQAKAAVAGAVAAEPHAKLIVAPNASYVEVDESFDRAWRRIGLALDRVGFTVEDRDRIQGIYFVRFIDTGVDAQAKPANAEKGFFSRMFSWGSSNSNKDGEKLQVAVRAGKNNTTTEVFVLGAEGKPATSAGASKALKLLSEQLK
ncbi:MAG: hypothetical protein RL748_2892, partial [Pseudomonadota bacterium]